MKLFKSLFATVVALMVTSAAFAADVTKTEAYAHPTMFGQQIQSTEGNGVYVVGDKLLKSEDVMSLKNRKDVIIDSEAKDILAILKANAKGVWNPKMPILRSEMAVVLAEGLKLHESTPKYQYKDITDAYWAKSWIDKALNEGVMIGYPDRNFRPDQPITKAEVFATLAQLIDVKTDNSKTLPTLNGYKMEQIPNWAIAPTKEVMASGLLNDVPDQKTVASDKYLTKEQVAYLVCALQENYLYNSKFSNAKYKPTYLKVKMSQRVDARHSNIGDYFYAVLQDKATVGGTCFEAGAQVKGEVVEISRPGVKNPGYMKVKFLSIKDGSTSVDFPRNITSATANTDKRTNFVARLFASPLSAVGRVGGVAGRSISAAGNVVSNGGEQLVSDNLSNTFANTLSLQPKAGLRSFGNGFVTVGKGVVNIVELAASGVFGVVYEFGDEVRYLILPSSINDSALNPGDELTVIY
jgi:hypothetical protein